MKYLRSRMSQGTTWIGLGVVAANVATSGVAAFANPETLTSIMLALGLVHVDR